MPDLSNMFLDTLDQVSDTLRGREFILPLISGDLVPQIDYTRYERAWEAAQAKGLNDTQCEALANAYATDLTYLIQGTARDRQNLRPGAPGPPAGGRWLPRVGHGPDPPGDQQRPQ